MVLTDKLYVAKIALLDVVNFWNVPILDLLRFFFIFKDSLLIVLNVLLISIYELIFLDVLLTVWDVLVVLGCVVDLGIGC
jgi:hypothetical protein